MFITRRKHNELMAAAGREIAAYQQAATMGRQEVERLKREKMALESELQPHRDRLDKQRANLAAANQARRDEALARKSA